MDNFKLKITLGDATIDLEGSSEMVYKILSELRQYGLGALSSNTTQTVRTPKPVSAEQTSTLNEQIEDQEIETEQNELNDDIVFQWPNITNVVLQGKPKTEAEWMLVYCAYCSEFGEKLFTEEEIKDIYRETNRFSRSVSANFMANKKKLISDDYISAVNSTSYRILPLGIDKAKGIVSGNGVSVARSKTNKKTSPSTYEIIDLALNEEERKAFREFWANAAINNNQDKAVLIAHWLNKNKDIVAINENHLFTMLRIAEQNTSYNLGKSLNNAKNQKNYFVMGEEPKHYKITHIGEDHVVHTLLKKE